MVTFAEALDDTAKAVRAHLERLDRSADQFQAGDYSPEKMWEDTSWYLLQVADDVPRLLGIWFQAAMRTADGSGAPRPTPDEPAAEPD